MQQSLTIDEIIQELHTGKNKLIDYCALLPNAQFFFSPPEKWSVAQQIKHLIISINTSRLAFTLPKFILKLITGKPNRLSRSYDELVVKYTLKLEQGGRASRRFIPTMIQETYGKEKLVGEFNTSINKIAAAIKNNWDETSIDNYLSPHPLLGKITLRELSYFTIYHSLHHLNKIENNTTG